MGKTVVVGKVRREERVGGMASGVQGLSTSETVIGSFDDEEALVDYLRSQMGVIVCERQPFGERYSNSVILHPENPCRVEYLVVFPLAEFLDWSRGSFTEVKL